MCICIYIYIYMYICICMCIYVYVLRTSTCARSGAARRSGGSGRTTAPGQGGNKCHHPDFLGYSNKNTGF